MKKLSALAFSLLLCVAFCVSAFGADNASAPSSPDTSRAFAACLYNVNTDKTVYSKNMHEKIYPGGTVKMMTGLIACEMLGDRLDERVTVTEKMLENVTGNSMKLKADMSVTCEDLLYGVLCAGGNDAAHAVAIACTGSVKAFVDVMNAKAKELGLENTHFTNPTGLDDKNMFSTLSDMMCIAKKAYENKLYVDLSSAMSYVFTPLGESDEIKLFNRNALISTFYAIGYRNPNCMGLISGNTDLSGNCVITYAQKKDTGYICAVMKADDDGDTVYSYEIANSLLKYGFDNFYYQRIAEAGQYVCDVPVRFAMPDAKSDNSTVRCIIPNDVFALTRSDITAQDDLKYRYYFHNDVLDAPVNAGDIVGGVDIIYNGEIIGNEKLVVAENVSASGMLVFFDGMKSFFIGRFFLLCVAFTVISIAAYCFHERRELRRKKVKRISYKNYY